MHHNKIYVPTYSTLPRGRARGSICQIKLAPLNSTQCSITSVLTIKCPQRLYRRWTAHKHNHQRPRGAAPTLLTPSLGDQRRKTDRCARGLQPSNGRSRFWLADWYSFKYYIHEGKQDPRMERPPAHELQYLGGKSFRPVQDCESNIDIYIVIILFAG